MFIFLFISCENDNKTIFFGGKILNKSADKIILNKDECFSTNVKDGFVTGSVDTNVYFLYSDYIKNLIYLNNDQKAKENLYYINLYEQYIKKVIKNDVKKRLKSDCYGKIDEEEFIKRVWKQKLTIKYFS